MRGKKQDLWELTCTDVTDRSYVKLQQEIAVQWKKIPGSQDPPEKGLCTHVSGRNHLKFELKLFCGGGKVVKNPLGTDLHNHISAENT